MTEQALPEGVAISPIRAFTDNYIWCLHDDSHAVIVDPGDAQPVLAWCRSNNLTITTILITHHHKDHTGGLARLISGHPGIPVIGPRGGHIRGITRSVTQGDRVEIPQLGCEFDVIETPGHTLDHIAFYGNGVVFCGDTLFSVGCGRLFEGSASQMSHSLNKLKRLPASTLIYCAHEYTLDNIRFAKAVEKDNASLQEYAEWVHDRREEDLPTIPSQLETQLAVNPFLRCHEPAVKASVASRTQQESDDDVAVFAALRAWKDEF